MSVEVCAADLADPAGEAGLVAPRQRDVLGSLLSTTARFRLARLRHVESSSDWPGAMRDTACRPHKEQRALESTGEVLTFFFSDIEGSTRRWATSAEEMAMALAAHDEALRAAVAEGGGRVLKHTGDGCVAVFGSPSGAVAAATAAQRRFTGVTLAANG